MMELLKVYYDSGEYVYLLTSNDLRSIFGEVFINEYGVRVYVRRECFVVESHKPTPQYFAHMQERFVLWGLQDVMAVDGVGEYGCSVLPMVFCSKKEWPCNPPPWGDAKAPYLSTDGEEFDARTKFFLGAGMDFDECRRRNENLRAHDKAQKLRGKLEHLWEF
jgi:hypothetical protein